MDKRKESINQTDNKKKLQNDKINRKILLTMIIVNLERFTLKSKIVIYTEIFVEFNN